MSINAYGQHRFDLPFLAFALIAALLSAANSTSAMGGPKAPGEARKATPLTDKDTVVLVDFDNKMQQQVAWASDKPGDEDALLSMESDTEAYYGRLVKAQDRTYGEL